MTWAGVTSLEPDWLVSQGWRVLGLRELGAWDTHGASEWTWNVSSPLQSPQPRNTGGEIKTLELTHAIYIYQDPKVT